MLEDRPSKILIVDDEPRNVRVLQVRLKSEGYDIIMAENGAEALEKTRKEQPDLILLDVMMPNMNGYEVCETLRADEATRFIPVIMVTALHEREHKLQGLEAGADDFITKPPDTVELSTRVRSLLRIKHFQDSLTHLNRELEIRNDVMEQDLRMAREVQQQLLPQDVTEIPGFHVAYHYTPESQVGGDFVDLTSMEHTRLGVFVADAMGHGAQAALVTVLLKTALAEKLGDTQEPEQILTGLNDRFVELLSGEIITYASGCYFRFEAEQKRIIYSNAGHPFPLLLNRADGTCVEVQGAGTGTGIGLLPGAEYETAEHAFGKDDVLLLFTDGIYEALNPVGGQYGVERMQEQLHLHRDKSLETMLGNLLEDMNNFTEGVPLADDVTLVAVELE